MKISQEKVSSGLAIWQTGRSPETAQGGFRLDTTGLTSGSTVKAGSVMTFDESTRIAKVVKTAKLYEDEANNETAYKVLKGHNFATGDYLAAATGGAAYAITNINTSNADYDVLTVGTTLGVVLTAGTPLFQSTATGASAAAAVAKGLLYEDTTVATDADVAVVLRGTVYERRTNGIPSTLKSQMPNIIASQSF